jgi:hypothetical protein
MDRKIEDFGYCGADCGGCNIYRAMTYGEELKPETIQRWREDAKQYWHVESLDPKDLNCRGCRNDYEGLFFGFTLCPIKKCCREKQLISCGVCPEFATCEWPGSEGRKNLENAAAFE